MRASDFAGVERAEGGVVEDGDIAGVEQGVTARYVKDGGPVVQVLSCNLTSSRRRDLHRHQRCVTA